MICACLFSELDSFCLSLCFFTSSTSPVKALNLCQGESDGSLIIDLLSVYCRESDDYTVCLRHLETNTQEFGVRPGQSSVKDHYKSFNVRTLLMGL